MVLTAVSWSAVPAACPASASGSRAPTARKAAVAIPLRCKDIAATVVAAAATSALMIATRRVSSVQT